MSIWSKRDCGTPAAAPPHDELAPAFSAPAASRAHSSPPRRISKVIQDIRTKREALAAHTGMSMCLVEFMASSPLGWLPVFPPSPRVSPDLLHKRNLRLSSVVDDGVGSSRLAASEQALQVQSAAPHSKEGLFRREQGRGQQAGSKVEKRVRNPGWEQKRRLPRKRIWGQLAKLTLLAMVVLGFLCSGKAAALGITSTAFVVFTLLWNIRNCGFFLTKKTLLSRLPFFSPTFLRSTDVHERRPSPAQPVVDLRMQHMKEEEAWEELQMTECRKEAERKEISSAKPQPMGWNSRAAKKKLHSSLRTLSLQIPHRALSHLSNSVPSSPANTLLSPDTHTQAPKTMPSDPHFTRHKSLSRLTTKGAASPTGIISPPPARSIATTAHPSTDSALDGGEIGSVHKPPGHRACESKLHQNRMPSSHLAPQNKSERHCIISGGRAMAIAVLLAMGGLLQGRMLALLSTACWFLLLSSLQKLPCKL